MFSSLADLQIQTAQTRFLHVYGVKINSADAEGRHENLLRMALLLFSCWCYAKEVCSLASCRCCTNQPHKEFLVPGLPYMWHHKTMMLAAEFCLVYAVLYCSPGRTCAGLEATAQHEKEVEAKGDGESFAKVDAICRLIEWGADVSYRACLFDIRAPNHKVYRSRSFGRPAQVNIADNKKRTPIHLAAAGGNYQATAASRGGLARNACNNESLLKACMLLLEMGADMNAKDRGERRYMQSHCDRPVMSGQP